jgi:hypothetical protein
VAVGSEFIYASIIWFAMLAAAAGSEALNEMKTRSSDRPTVIAASRSASETEEGRALPYGLCRAIPRAVVTTACNGGIGVEARGELICVGAICTHTTPRAK